MSTYKVYLVTIASTTVTVEADDFEEALDKVYTEAELPYAPGYSNYDFGEWILPSEMNPEFNRSEDDYEEVSA